MKTPSRKKISVIVIVALIAIVAGYRVFLRPLPVAVAVVRQATLRDIVQGPGTVQSKVPVTVSAKITGILEKLYVDQGDRVRKGQLLAELDSAEQSAREAAARSAHVRASRQWASAKADLAKAQANLLLAESNYRRDLAVYKQGYISSAAFDVTHAALQVAQSDVAAGEAAVKASEASVRQAESDTRTTRVLLGYTRILSPMDGVITVRQAEVGDTISPGTPIFQLVGDPIWAASWIDETRLGALHVGQKASITLRSGQVYQGKVARLNSQADTVTRELEVDVQFAILPKPLLIGEETDVAIDAGQQTALAVPLSAIAERDGHRGVRIVSDGRARFRPIVTGLQDAQRAAVLQGLKEGETVVINPAGIRPGKKVAPRIAEPGKGNGAL
jgi:HlyD family secretion protein